MNIDQMITELESPSARNDTLKLLAEILVDTDPRLVQSLSTIINMPETIENTNHFASVLESLSQAGFIAPLIECISRGKPGETPWLADYMYALECLADAQDDSLRVEESFVHLLGKWLLTTEGGEISWKAGLILAHIEHSATRQYYLEGALDQNLLHLTRVACIRGIVNHFREEADELLEKLSNDSDEYVRGAVEDARQFLNTGVIET